MLICLVCLCEMRANFLNHNSLLVVNHCSAQSCMKEDFLVDKPNKRVHFHLEKVYIY